MTVLENYALHKILNENSEPSQLSPSQLYDFNQNGYRIVIPHRHPSIASGSADVNTTGSYGYYGLSQTAPYTSASFPYGFHTGSAIPLGFGFPFDTYTYHRCYVNSYGFIVLTNDSGTAAVGMPSITISTNTFNNNVGTEPLVAPWWDTLELAPSNDGGGVFVKYALDQERNEKIFIVRWVVWPSSGYDRAVITFECWLRERGLIEYRYCKKSSTIKGIPDSVAGASCGVIGIGNTSPYARKRDFFAEVYGATVEYKHGGSIYSNNNTLKYNSDWPGNETTGVRFEFYPIPVSREKLPRVELRKQDTYQTYPIELSTGNHQLRELESRLYDDRKSITYESLVTSPAGRRRVVTYPTTIPRMYSDFNGKRRDIYYVHTDIEVSGSTIKSAAEEWIAKREQKRYNNPFVEIGLHEQDIKSTEFYASGTTPTELGTAGFDSSIASKTQLRLEFYNSQKYTFATQSSEFVYFSPSTNKFERRGFADGEGWANFQGFVFSSPYGYPILSGSEPFDSYKIGDLVTPGGSDDTTTVASLLDIVPDIRRSTAFLTASAAATSSQYFTVGQINHPFLLEKLIVEFPFEAGAGWFNDWTVRRDDQVGGPAITFALLNQIRDDYRDIIVTGSFIPRNDDTETFEIGSFGVGVNDIRNSGFSSVATAAATITPSNSTFTGSVRLNLEATITTGFLLGTENTSTDLNNALVLTSIPNGRTTAGLQRKNGRSYGRNLIGPSATSSFNILSELGASEALKAAASTAFCTYNYTKTQKSPYIVYPNDKLILAFSKCRPCIGAGAAFTSSHDAGIGKGPIRVTLYGSLIRNEAEFHSQLQQSTVTDAVHTVIGDDHVLDQFDVEATEHLSGSIYDQYVTGSMTLRTRNDLIDRRYIGSIVFSREGSQLSGSFATILTPRYERCGIPRFSVASSDYERYWDSCVPGLADVIKRSSPYSRGLPSWPYGERFIFGYRGTLVNTGSVKYPGTVFGYHTRGWEEGFPFAGLYADTQRFTSPQSALNVAQLFTSSFDNVAGVDGSDSVDHKIGWHDYVRYQQGSNYSNPHSITNEARSAVWLIDVPFSTGTMGAITNSNSGRYDDKIKHIYGFGDGIGNLDYLSGSFYDSALSNRAHLRASRKYRTGFRKILMHDYQGFSRFSSYINSDYWFTDLTNCLYGVGSIVRGWKYGLVSGLPYYTRAVFRRDHYGHPRDMLEQRHDTKFVYMKNDNSPGAPKVQYLSDSPVKIRFVNPETGASVDPVLTDSCNLSNEATSSLPFFDDTLRNRPVVSSGNSQLTVVTPKFDQQPFTSAVTVPGISQGAAAIVKKTVTKQVKL